MRFGKLSLSLFVLTAAGCAAPPAETGESTSAWTLSSDNTPLLFPGGIEKWAGKPLNDGRLDTLKCNPGDVAVGVWGTYDNYITRMGLDCAELFPDGSIQSPYMTYSYATGSAGGDVKKFFEVLCPDGYAVYGLTGTADDHIDKVGLRCELAPFPNGYETANPVSAIEVAPVGGSGGKPFKMTCGRQRVLTQLLLDPGYNNDSIHAMDGLCTFITNP
jgi:hypothetical protein